MLPKGFTFPEKLDLDWKLIKDADNFCSKIGNDDLLHYYGHELMVAIGAYKLWVRDYNGLAKDDYSYKREQLFFRSQYSETKARLIILGTNPKEATEIALRRNKMMLFTAEFKNLTTFTTLVQVVPLEPYENLRKAEAVERTVHIEHGVGTAKITIEGIDHVFELPQTLADVDETRTALSDSTVNLRIAIHHK